MAGIITKWWQGLQSDEKVEFLLPVPEELSSLSTGLIKPPWNGLFCLTWENQVNPFWFISLLWTNYIEMHLVSKKVRHSTSRLRWWLLISIFEGFLNPFPPNCNWVDKSNLNLTKEPWQIEELLSRTHSSIEQVTPVESAENVYKLDAVNCSELNELRHVLHKQVNPESVVHDVNAVSSKQSNPSLPTLQCFSCGSTMHLQRQCSHAPPVWGGGHSRGRGNLHRLGRLSF